jgi:hypothetical protein
VWLHSVIKNFPSQLLPIYCGHKQAVQSLTDFSFPRGGSLLTRLETSHISIQVLCGGLSTTTNDGGASEEILLGNGI